MAVNKAKVQYTPGPGLFAGLSITETQVNGVTGQSQDSAGNCSRLHGRGIVGVGHRAYGLGFIFMHIHIYIYIGLIYIYIYIHAHILLMTYLIRGNAGFLPSTICMPHTIASGISNTHNANYTLPNLVLGGRAPKLKPGEQSPQSTLN